MSATAHAEVVAGPRPLWRRAALAVCVVGFLVLWAGGVAGQWASRTRGDEGWLASAFLMLAALLVLLGARTRGDVLKLAAVALLGFAVEAVGVRTGFPFGEYAYTGVLRPQVLGVPVAIGAAWLALVAFSSEVVGRFRLPVWPAALAAALWTTATDLVIDPLAANHFGYWNWAARGNYYGIPFTNFLGWFLTALFACRLLGPRPLPNSWAVFVGAGILLFFASIALAHSLFPVALLGFGLSAAGVLTAAKPRPN